MAKRLLDVVLGVVLIFVCLPVILVLAIVSAAVLRTWPLFLHERVGHHGRLFRLPKLRTLPPTVSTTADKYELKALELPRFCRFLRKTHLDELPQLLLLPTGQMSLVGPRPEMPHLHELGDRDFNLVRISKRPGCTGLWQISPDADRLISEAPSYDLLYARHASLRLDLWILWRTALLFTGLSGPVPLYRIPAWVLRTNADIFDSFPTAIAGSGTTAT